MSLGTAGRTSSDSSPLDTTVRLVTPERITFMYPLAGPFRRAGAYLIDLLVLLLLVVAGQIAAVALSLGSAAGMGLFFAFLFALQFGYGAVCEALLNGQTIGKKAMGLRVVAVEGVPITGAQAFLRNLLWPFDGAIPFAYLPAIVSMFLTKRFQRLGDLAAGTMVVVEEHPPRGRVVVVTGKEIDAVLAWLPGRIAAGPELSRALADYVRHRPRFTAPRREEMAATLAGPVRARYKIPAEAPADAVVCALYQRVFLGN
jgi:uncharacterized RDD family membrane protein YckC